jgi:hypothetical protein
VDEEVHGGGRRGGGHRGHGEHGLVSRVPAQGRPGLVHDRWAAASAPPLPARPRRRAAAPAPVASTPAASTPAAAASPAAAAVVAASEVARAARFPEWSAPPPLVTRTVAPRMYPQRSTPTRTRDDPIEDLTIYLAGEIHSDWGDQLRGHIANLDIPADIDYVRPQKVHDRSGLERNRRVSHPLLGPGGLRSAVPHPRGGAGRVPLGCDQRWAKCRDGIGGLRTQASAAQRSVT